MRHKARLAIAELLYRCGWCWVELAIWACAPGSRSLWRLKRQSHHPWCDDFPGPCSGCKHGGPARLREFPEVVK